MVFHLFDDTNEKSDHHECVEIACKRRPGTKGNLRPQRHEEDDMPAVAIGEVTEDQRSYHHASHEHCLG